MAIIVKVGQVWSNGSYSIEITKIVGRSAHVITVGQSNGERSFGYVRSDGTPDGWGGWSLIPAAIEVKVGQVWCDGIDHIKFTRIDGGSVYYTRPNGTEGCFGSLRADGTPDGWSASWQLEQEVTGSPTAAKSSPTSQDDPLTSFFKSVSSGHCACNIPREQCSYHRP